MGAASPLALVRAHATSAHVRHPAGAAAGMRCPVSSTCVVVRFVQNRAARLHKHTTYAPHTHNYTQAISLAIPQLGALVVSALSMDSLRTWCVRAASLRVHTRTPVLGDAGLLAHARARRRARSAHLHNALT